jgi:hypothetical protein
MSIDGVTDRDRPIVVDEVEDGQGGRIAWLVPEAVKWLMPTEV